MARTRLQTTLSQTAGTTTTTSTTGTKTDILNTTGRNGVNFSKDIFPTTYLPTSFNKPNKFRFVNDRQTLDKVVVASTANSLTPMSSYLKNLKNMQSFIGENGDAHEIIDYEKEVGDIVGDLDFIANSLTAGDTIVLAKIPHDILKNVGVINKATIWYGAPVEDGNLVMKVTEGMQLVNGSAAVDGTNIVLNNLVPITECSTDFVCPGWKENTYKFFYKVYDEDDPVVQADEMGFWTPWTYIDSFWLKYEPSKFRGLVVCAPNPMKIMQYNWQYSKTSFFLYLIMFAIFLMFIIRRYVKSVLRVLPNEVTQLGAGLVDAVDRATRGGPKTRGGKDKLE